MSDEHAQLDPTPDREYSEFEAKDAFERMVTRYGYRTNEQFFKSLFV